MSTYDVYKDIYLRNWTSLAIRQDRLSEINHACGIVLKNKSRYGKITELTGVPWWFIALQHYRESDFDFTTYLGNGQSLHHVTTEVPKHRGPFDRFEDGAFDAEMIQGFVGARDWSCPRVSYRLEAFNGFGYHAHGVNSPYLYGGSKLYGPPESRGGKYIGDHDFSPRANDSQLGTVTILKRLVMLDDSIGFQDVPVMQPEPDETKAELTSWTQQALNMVEHTSLVIDGSLGKSTMKVLAQFQKQHNLTDSGLPDRVTIETLQRAVTPSERRVPRSMLLPKQAEQVYPLFHYHRRRHHHE